MSDDRGEDDDDIQTKVVCVCMYVCILYIYIYIKCVYCISCAYSKCTVAIVGMCRLSVCLSMYAHV